LRTLPVVGILLFSFSLNKLPHFVPFKKKKRGGFLVGALGAFKELRSA
jgi:hypothetical protein